MKNTELNNNKRNQILTALIRFENLLKERKAKYNKNLNPQLRNSIAADFISHVRLTNLLEEKQKDDLITKFESEANDIEELFNLVITEVKNAQSNLGYGEEVKEEKAKVNSDNIIESYEKVLTIIENMIEELDKSMNQLDNWISEISNSIHYDYKKSKDVEEEVSNGIEEDKELDNLNDFVPIQQ